MSTPQDNKKPSWSTSAAILGWSVSTVSLWAGLCAVPEVKPMLKGQQLPIIAAAGLITAGYCGKRFTGLTPAETETYWTQVRAENEAKKIKAEMEAAKKAKKD